MQQVEKLKKTEQMKIVQQRNLARGIFELTLAGNLVEKMTTAGQFLHLKVPDQSFPLRRPISLAQVDRENQTCRLIYRVVGRGTDYFSKMKVGETIDVLGPLGHGFEINFLKKEESVLVIGGGIGIPPMYELTRKLVSEIKAKVTVLLGFASQADSFYLTEFDELAEQVLISTDDGTLGTKGNISDLLTEVESENFAAVYACGAQGLLRVVDQQFADHDHAYLSAEARMACGLGACYGCTIPKRVASDSQPQLLRVCDQGPVFRCGEVVI